jgi:hypothetical protein
MLGSPKLRHRIPGSTGTETPVFKEMTMATLTVKARTKPADAKANPDPATSARDYPGRSKAPEQNTAGESPARYRSLREYLKVNH